MKEFLKNFSERGFLHQMTDEENLAKKQQVTAYIGFDCTAETLHIGSLVQIMTLRMLQKFGHKPIILVGGGTTKVGDPSGKDESRKLLDDAKIQQNMEGIKKVLSKFIKFDDSENSAVMVNNDDWLKSLNYIDFLRDYGCHFSVNRMLSFDSVKIRLERQQNLSFLEFNYMLLQAFDFVHLSKSHNCTLQIGGSDQWGNIVNGIELSRRLGGKELFGLTTPLITNSDGSKMGKTANGAVWLSQEHLPVFDYFQFWRNVQDADVVKFLKLFTELPLDEIEKLNKLQGQEINEAKKILAFEATKICHGEEDAQKVLNSAVGLFEQNNSEASLEIVEIEESNLGMSIVDLLCHSELCASKGEARRLIQGGGAKINDVKISNIDEILSAQHFQNGSLKLSSGKKKHKLIKII